MLKIKAAGADDVPFEGRRKDAGKQKNTLNSAQKTNLNCTPFHFYIKFYTPK